jgi:hypothetical protein
MGERMIRFVQYEGEEVDLYPQYPNKIKVFKNGVESGWYKDVESGINAIKATCEVHGFVISDYEFRKFDNTTVVWRGTDENN